MKDFKEFDAIIIGGSYSGLAAGMALGRALRQVLIIDSGAPCNAQTPFSHNFLTQDGETPAAIAKLAKQQVQAYPTISFVEGLAIKASKTQNGFSVQVSSGDLFHAKKLIFATGVKDQMAQMEGFKECWGISILHCPYCHGYEVRNEKTGILGNGEVGYEFAQLINNWTDDLTIFTNGAATFTMAQLEKLKKNNIKIVENEIEKLAHVYGNLQHIVFKDDTTIPLKAIYTRTPFKQHCDLIETLGCKLTEDGYVKIDDMQRTTIDGVFACGDNATRMRSVANAVAQGTFTGAVVNRQIIAEEF
ncbi:NAD(P)/FAD-dependent oxidoreductase [Pedobacter polaris]|uniref:NAD(P)/FAD-dependent oxidoreductase n=2 Tax=Pedobacter polaris TaxID=2571273 RepID=A0A4V5P0C7_9SPHI|nr:NAD(P)/FAD-dependent oxidoreductase [Pedobacter polaris]